ncbi:hypothetical protein SODALDRAFT_185241 [Sodiomyces alkalinus F11]|uniref:Uncharacterized protein n=1 Tax=Sodiomyces alkalinus (strain CBS 110278 / VKM F-3762 / F11) TaxID=1314773 RepID=A0A3N2PUU3_SODAK|nr:hypothetical protein SODALDRAFT_185241 [Sodiomyces alkalinus F11]ROT38261.1 hypothetical protein SODALDRAFT_185241 [Sodiomyces alkalinus F11]
MSTRRPTPTPGGQGSINSHMQTLDPLAACYRDCKPLLLHPSSPTPQEFETGVRALVKFGGTVDWDVVRRRLREEATMDELARTKRYLALLVPLYDQLLVARGLPSAPVGDIVFNENGWRRIVSECEEVLLDGSTQACCSSCASCRSSSSKAGGEGRTSQSSSSYSSSSVLSPSSAVSSAPSSTASPNRVQAEARIRAKPELRIFYHGEDMRWGVPVPVCGFPPRIAFTQEGTVTDGHLTLPLGPGTTGEAVLLELFAREDLPGSFSGAVVSADGWLSYGAFQTVRVGPGTLGERHLLPMRCQGRKYGLLGGGLNWENAARPDGVGRARNAHMANACTAGPVPVPGKFGGSCGWNANETPQNSFQGGDPFHSGNANDPFTSRSNGLFSKPGGGGAFAQQPSRVEDVEMGGMDDVGASFCASRPRSVFDAPFLQRGFGTHNTIQAQQQVNVFYGGGGGAGGNNGTDSGGLGKVRIDVLLDMILEAHESQKQTADAGSDDAESDESAESAETEQSEESEESEEMDVETPEQPHLQKNGLSSTIRGKNGGWKRPSGHAGRKPTKKFRKRVSRRRGKR